jgi:hypothetical protein
MNREQALGKIVVNAITAIIFFFWLCLSCSLETDTVKKIIFWCLASVYLGVYCVVNNELEEEEECY